MVTKADGFDQEASGGRCRCDGSPIEALRALVHRLETSAVVANFVGERSLLRLAHFFDSVSFIGDRQRMIISGVFDKFLTVDAPNTVKAQAGERIGLLIAADAVRLLPPED
jgi:putative spermidine/putrescine transport system ATP-binding protein